MRLTGERYTTARTELAVSVTARPTPLEPGRHDLVPLTQQHEDDPMTGPQHVAAALYEAINVEDFTAVRALLAPDVVGKVNDLAAPVTEHQGADALVEHLLRRCALGESSYRIDGWEFHEHPKPDHFAKAEVRHSAMFAGDRIASVALHIMRIEEGRIALMVASLPSGDVDGRWLGLVA